MSPPGKQCELKMYFKLDLWNPTAPVCKVFLCQGLGFLDLDSLKIKTAFTVFNHCLQSATQFFTLFL